MCSIRIVFILFYLALFCNLCVTQNTHCESHQTCSKCIQHSECSWCKEINFETSSHCVMSENIHKRCQSEHVNPRTRETYRKAQNQFQPGVVHVDLRPGHTYNLNFNYTLGDFPVDLYYLMDLSASMDVHRDKLSKLASELSKTMESLTHDFKMGFGSFVDKTAQPFVNTVPAILANPCNALHTHCTPAYSFRNHLSLMKDVEIFSKEVRDAPLSGNIDSPEGGLDAIMQAIVCKEIGWRINTRKLLIFSTDDAYHIAGDGKLAGIVKPNDGLCHMNSGNYTYSLRQDYPSIGQINATVTKHNIVLVFVVVQSQENIYHKLKDNIRGAQIGILSTDSANVVELVKNIYTNIASTVKIYHNFPNEFKVNLRSPCLHNVFKETNECLNIKTGTTIPFEATITLQKCPENDIYNKEYFIKVEGVSDNITIVANMLCECDCEKVSDPNYEQHSKKCSEAGDLQCGICKCDLNRSGQTCQCDGDRDQTDNIETCRPNRTAEICSGLGQCKCGVCDCNKRPNPDEQVTGKYCECDNYSCKRIDDRLCSGSTRGRCVCGKCECLNGWSGEACDCPTTQEQCIPSANQEVCSGHGFCVCGRCECTQNQTHRYSGEFCANCLSCREQKCEEFRNCVECKIHETGNFSQELCETNCHNYEIGVIEDNENSDAWVCSYLDENGCTFKFNFSYDDSDKLSLIANKHKNCPQQLNTASLASGIIASIILPIIIGLIVWKVCVTYRDKREYMSFLEQQKLAKWEEYESPLFIDPIGKFTNPTYGQ